MLGKLLKYELKASARTLLPLYAGTLLIALICGVSMAVQTSNMNKFHQSMTDGVAVTFSSFSNPVDGDLYTFIGFGMLLVFAFCVAVTVLTIMSVVQRFNHGIAGNEGYLMFTLPVKHETLLASKLLGALLWSLASLLVFFLVGVLIGGPSLFVEREFFDWAFFWERVQELFRYYNPLPSMLLTAVNAVLSLVSVILTIYLSIMIGQMEQFNKYRVAVAVAAFFVIHWIFGLVESLLFGLPGINMMPEGAARVSDLYNGYYFIVGSDCLFTAALCVLCFFGTAWMMKKKLNL
ncbi:MAG: ABC-2 transporter permease [Peptococcaceae bacterium]|nr:ABC-2 transporter permease [Peptococcaceae bacterium]